MNMSAKIGFDGERPEFKEKRGSEIRDPKTGAIVRDAEMGIQNVGVDRIEWLLAHKRIEPHQHAAGRRLQGDWELSLIGGYSTLQALPGGSGTNRLSDAKCDAIGRVNAARIHMGNTGWRIIELVVLENVSLGKAESRMRMAVGNGAGALQAALDCLARHYGLA